MAVEARHSRRVDRLGADLLRRVREASGASWEALSRSGRVALVGVAASAVLAVALGVAIPRIAEHHVLGARLDAIRSLVRALQGEDLIPDTDERLAGAAYRAFDDVVRGGLLGGENLRVKLWNRRGEIVYSDEPGQVGRRYPITPGLRAAFDGRASVAISDLSAAENELDRPLGDRLLEFYVPVRRGGEVVAAFEIYQDSAPLAAHLRAIRTAVWLAVGSGLSVLLVFLVLLFAATARTMARERRAALDRADDLAVLLETSSTLSSEISLARTAPRILTALTSRLALRCAAVMLDADRPPLCSASGGEAGLCASALGAARRALGTHVEVTEEAIADPALAHARSGTGCSVTAVPFRAGPGGAGVLVACRGAEDPLTDRERSLVVAVASQVGVAAESARLFDDLQRMTLERGLLLRRLVDAQEEERRRLVGDLHDGVLQVLARILYGLRGCQARLPDGLADIRAELLRLEALADEQSRSLRRHLAAIRPALLEDFGLVRSLGAFAREQQVESGLAIDVIASGVREPDPAVGVTLFRAAQEAVMNVRKHADARHVSIRLAEVEGGLLLQVEDDGRGAERIEDGIGLSTMRDRVASLGGRVDVRSRPGQGTVVTVHVPVEGNGGGPAGPGR
jgi:two-component system NarL family sensor kinase